MLMFTGVVQERTRMMTHAYCRFCDTEIVWQCWLTTTIEPREERYLQPKHQIPSGWYTKQVVLLSQFNKYGQRSKFNKYTGCRRWWTISTVYALLITFQNMFPVSKIATSFSRTTASYKISQGLVPCDKKTIVEDLVKLDLPLSMHFDETSTAQVKKRMDLILHYWLNQWLNDLMLPPLRFIMSLWDFSTLTMVSMCIIDAYCRTWIWLNYKEVINRKRYKTLMCELSWKCLMM